ncbi:MAG TPA: universal stress protein [Rugosimonospora sp.]|nr:universal stress protein [Rugosimonospora sp.]
MTNQGTGRVIVGVHDCLAGLQALRCAVAEARRRGTSLCAVRAWTMPYAGQGVGLRAWRQELVDEAALTVYGAFATALGGLPGDVEVRVLAPEGAPSRCLVDLSDRDDDLLVVGDCQRRRLRRAWSRSVARYCARHAICPVLVVPPPALARLSRHDLSREAQRFIDAS